MVSEIIVSKSNSEEIEYLSALKKFQETPGLKTLLYESNQETEIKHYKRNIAAELKIAKVFLEDKDYIFKNSYIEVLQIYYMLTEGKEKQKIHMEIGCGSSTITRYENLFAEIGLEIETVKERLDKVAKYLIQRMLSGEPSFFKGRKVAEETGIKPRQAAGAMRTLCQDEEFPLNLEKGSARNWTASWKPGGEEIAREMHPELFSEI